MRALQLLVHGYARLPRWVRWLGAAMCAYVIFRASSRASLGGGDNAFLGLLFNCGHIVAFAGLSGAVLMALAPPAVWRTLHLQLAVGVTAVYAITDEVHQHFVGRHASVLDLLTDGCAAGLAVAILCTLVRRDLTVGRRWPWLLAAALTSAMAATWLPY